MGLAKIGLYVHIPFCRRKCAYCDFYSLTDLSLRDRYLDALCRQILLVTSSDRWSNPTVDTVYFGGGTPSLFGTRRLESLWNAILDRFSISADAEVTLEANPSTVDADGLRELRAMGVNRLSLGLQSANDRELEDLSRIHDYSGFRTTYSAARAAGFDNISIDLMYGIPGQTVVSLTQTLKTVTDLAPEHLSLYGLRVEPETPFGRMGDRLILPDEDTQCEMYVGAVDLLERRGYHRYEISNFAREGYESRHNLRYWLGGEYLGLGPAAHSYLDGERYSTVRDLSAYLETLKEGKLPEKLDPQVIDESERSRERIIFGLRLEKGIECDEMLRKKAEPFIRSGHMKLKDGRLSFTTKGFLVSTPLLAELIDDGQ